MKKDEYPELNIDINPESLIYSKWDEMFKNSQIKVHTKNIEVWSSDASSKALAYLTHGIFRYFGKFPPPIARYLMKTYTSENDTVIDPMCGSGTSALEALLLNRQAFCFDVNPLAILLSKVKITKIDRDVYLKSLEKVSNLYFKDGGVYTSLKFPGLKDPSHWILPETAESISKILSAINLTPEADIKDALKISLLSVIRRVSRATSQQGRLFLDVETAEKDVFPFFEKKAREVIEKINLLPENNKVYIKTKNILNAQNKDLIEAKLIICHPPYFNAYKYSSINSLELSCMDIDHATVREDEIREFFKVGKPEKITSYIDDMEVALRNLSSYISSQGVLALMIGDTIIKGEYIPVTKLLLDRLQDIYIVDKAAFRIPKFTEASWATSQRRNNAEVGINLCDIIVILRKR